MTNKRLGTAAVVFLLVSGGVAAQAGSSADGNEAKVRRALKAKGHALHVCRVGTNATQGVCWRVSELSAAYPTTAAQLGKGIEEAMIKLARARAALTENKALEEALSVPSFVGCMPSKVNQGGVVLSLTDLGGGGLANTSKAAAQLRGCATTGTTTGATDTGGVAEPGRTITIAYGDFMDAVTFLREYQKGNCGGPGSWLGPGGMMDGDDSNDTPAPAPSTDAPPPGDPPSAPSGAKPAASAKASGYDPDTNMDTRPSSRSKAKLFIGKVWYQIYKALGGSDGDASSGGGTIGVRGYCFDDMACAKTACSRDSGLRAAATVLKERYRYSGCNSNATPTPDSSSTCYAALNLRPFTEEMRKKLWLEACRQRATVSAIPEGSNACAVPLDKPVKPLSSACTDPRAMCSPDQVSKPPVIASGGKLPGTGVGPVPSGLSPSAGKPSGFGVPTPGKLGSPSAVIPARPAGPSVPPSRPRP